MYRRRRAAAGVERPMASTASHAITHGTDHSPEPPDAVSERVSLKERTLQGITWSFITRIAGQVVQYGVSIVLARILFPADFGLVGMVSVFTGFAAIFIDFGIGSAIVQR